MKNIKHLIILLLLIIIFPVKAAYDYDSLSNNEEYDSYPLLINKMDVTMNVHDNNTIEVKNTISAYFNQPAYGIKMTVPLERVITRKGSSNFIHRATISDIDVPGGYAGKKGKGIYEITTGSIDRSLTMEQTIRVNYLYKLGYDGTKDEDTLYFALKNQYLDAPVGKMHFEVTLPKDFNKKKLAFYDENGHKIMGEELAYSFKGNTIVGDYTKVLMPGEELIITCTFENGYFYIESSKFNKIAMFSIPALCALIGVAYLIIKKTTRIHETVEFYPPESLNSVEMGYIIDGKINVSDVLSLLPHLASLGYIKIVENNKENYTILKMREYDGNKASEKAFMDNLFAPLEEGSEEPAEFVPNESIFKVLSKTVSSLKQTIKPEVYNYWVKTPTTSIILYLTCMLLAVFIPMLIITTEILIFKISAKLVIITIIALILFILSLLRKMPIMIKVVIYIAGLMPLYIGIVSNLMEVNKISLFIFIYSAVCGLILMICFHMIPSIKIKDDQRRILERIKGFKKFIEEADKDTLETIRYKNPEYYTDIYSYAFAFGLSTKWITKYETMTVEMPEWFELAEETLDVNAHFLDNFDAYMLEKQVTIEKALQMDTPKAKHEYKIEI